MVMLITGKKRKAKGKIMGHMNCIEFLINFFGLASLDDNEQLKISFREVFLN